MVNIFTIYSYDFEMFLEMNQIRTKKNIEIPMSCCCCCVHKITQTKNKTLVSDIQKKSMLNNVFTCLIVHEYNLRD